MASENAKAPRRRRAPEEAREELLNAADRLLFERGPEVVGLKDVAAEVGVTHSLVVHYFGSYAGLVRAVLVRRNQQAAAEALARFSEASATLDFEALGRHVFAFVSDRQRVRLSLWLSFQEDDAPIEQGGGRMLRLLIDNVEAALPEIRRRQGKPPVSRDAIERAVLLIMAAGQGYALSGAQRWNALGHQPSPDLDGSFFRALWIGVEAILDALNLLPAARAQGETTLGRAALSVPRSRGE